MSIKSFISTLCLLALSACSLYPYEDSDIYVIIKGKVTDEAGAPIEHIEVGIEFSSKDIRTLYTSSEGTFICDITYGEAKDMKKIDLRLTDTDGEENGGYFAPHSEVIIIYDEMDGEIPRILNLDFHCSRANL